MIDLFQSTLVIEKVKYANLDFLMEEMDEL